MKAFKLATAILALSTGLALAENPMVGGAAMFEDKTIVENAVNSADHTTLVAAVQAAGGDDVVAGFAKVQYREGGRRLARAECEARHAACWSAALMVSSSSMPTSTSGNTMPRRACGLIGVTLTRHRCDQRGTRRQCAQSRP